MFGDDDPDIAPFFAKFLGEGPPRRAPPPRRDGRIRESRYAADVAPLTNGLAIGLTGAAAILEDAARPAPGVRVRSERAEIFHRLLEDMANDIMQNGPHIETIFNTPSREATPRPSPRRAPSPPQWQTSHGVVTGPDVPDVHRHPAELAEPLPPSLPSRGPLLPERQAEAQQADGLEESSNESADEDVSDVVDITRAAGTKYPLMDFGASRPLTATPANHIRLSVDVELDNGSRVLDNMIVHVDSSLEDLFVQIEGKVGIDIPSLITRPSSTCPALILERAGLPIKWSGLQDGDLVTAVLHPEPAVPSVQGRRFQVVTAPHDSLADKWLSKRFPNTESVSMGAFGDTIAKGADAEAAGAYPSTRAASTNLPLASHWQGIGGNDVDGDGLEMLDHWQGGLGLTAAIQSGAVDLNLVPPIPPSAEAWDVCEPSNAMPPLPTPPECMPDEFEDLPADAFITPQNHADGVEGLPQQVADLVSPNKPRPPRKVAASPPPPASAARASPAATTPTSSRLSDVSFAPTPSRRPQGQPRASPEPSAEELKKKLEEKQKQNDAIWANIAATLEPAQLEPARRTFMSHTGSAGSLGKKVGLSQTMSSMGRRHR